MDKTDKEVLELCKSWFEDIMERSNRLTSGNVSHGRRAIHGVAKNYAEYVDEHLHNRWKQSDEQKHSIDINKMVDDYANNKERGNEEFGKPVPCMIRAYRQGLNDAIGKVVLKPAWSEEDEDFFNDVIAFLEDARDCRQNALDCIDWLESLKARMGG